MRDQQTREVQRSRRQRPGHRYGRSRRGHRRFRWRDEADAQTPDAPAALRALFVHERALAAACNELPTDGRAQQLVFLAAYHLLAVAAKPSGAWHAHPSERVARRGSTVIHLGSTEADVALGFVRLLCLPGWQRFSLGTMLDWDAQVRVAFLKACTRA
jgi:hypothetical protein